LVDTLKVFCGVSCAATETIRRATAAKGARIRVDIFGLSAEVVPVRGGNAGNGVHNEGTK
jgi:hypothetical protein